MTPFLYQLATLFYERYGKELSRLAFVFPNRRAGLFFQKYLSEVADRPLFSPKILTINDLFVSLSGKQAADRIHMLFMLYEIYVRRSGSMETFDEFLYWGEMLLNDFADIDKYMVNARMLFSNMKDLKEIEDGFDYLSEEQIMAIRSFWSSFNPIKSKEGISHEEKVNQRHFLEVWEVLYGLYKEFRDTLAEEGKGYDGMIFREVVEDLERGADLELPYEQIVFVGLNALSVSEERFLVQLQKRGKADFYWDYESEKVTDPDNKASYFVSRNLKNFPSLMKLPKEDKNQQRIEVIGIPSGIGQAKQVYSILNEWCDQAEMDSDEALRTAVILPDEHLLVPVLNAIPERIQRINVTMGYPLVGTPVSSLIEYIFSLQKNVRYVDGFPLFYFRDVLAILNHRYVQTVSPEEVSSLVLEITENNKVYISPSEIKGTSLLEMLFKPIIDVHSFLDYLLAVLEELNREMSDQDAEEDEPETQKTKDLEQEFIFHYFAAVNRMKDIIQKAHVEMRLDTFCRLLKRVTETLTIPFHGEPLSGLQIMGVLETRALDFDRLIILSMNEGIFPQRKAANSFIPYNLRKGFGLPTYEHQDSVWAYHFYRLIERAHHVCLLYDTRSNFLQTGEVSRFVHQLRYHYEVPLEDKLVVYNVAVSKAPVLSVPKDERVMQLLDAYRKGGQKALSASAINAYLDCPMKFYFSVLEGIREEDKVSEVIESNVFGSILHKVMEELYKPFKGKMVTTDLLQAIRKDTALMRGAIARAFASEFFKSKTVRSLEGQNFLTGEVIRKYVDKILEEDGKLSPFIYIDSERKIRGLMRLSDQSDIQLKGFIDRIDEVDGVVRIIDYKTGMGDTSFESIDGLFDISNKKREKAVMQVFLYCWMYNHLEGNKEKEICPGIYYARSLFKNFNPSVFQKIGFRKKEKVDGFSCFSEEFEEALRTCLDQIFDAKTPFEQVKESEHCSNCAFRVICGR